MVEDVPEDMVTGKEEASLRLTVVVSVLRRVLAFQLAMEETEVMAVIMGAWIKLTSFSFRQFFTVRQACACKAVTAITTARVET